MPSLEFLKKRAARQAIFSATGALLVLGIVILLNVLTNYLYVRLDLSKGKIYSLSSASKKLIKRLDDPVLIKAYFSKSLPPQYSPHRDYLRDLLKEYRTTSRGKVSFEFVQYEDEDKFREEAQRQGIAPVQFNIVSKENYEVRQAFLGLTMNFEDKKEVIPFLQDIAGLEYDLTSRIKRLTTEKKASIGFLTSHGAAGDDALEPGLREKISQNYQIASVDLAKTDAKEGIDRNLTALLILGPKEKFSDGEISLLDAFLNSGKSIGACVNVYDVDLKSFYARPLMTGLPEWLKRYGLDIDNSLVMDLQNQRISVSQRQGFMTMTNIVAFPPFPISTALAAEHPITKGFSTLPFPFAAPLRVSTAAAAAQNMETGVLARSSPNSWAARVTSINPFQGFMPAESDPRGPFALAGYAQDKSRRILAVGTADFVSTNLAPTDANMAFFLNIVDWLAQDSDLIAIRSKLVAYAPLKEISGGAKSAVKYANMLGAPLAVVLCGVFRWRQRRRAKLRAAARWLLPTNGG